MNFVAYIYAVDYENVPCVPPYAYQSGLSEHEHDFVITWTSRFVYE